MCVRILGWDKDACFCGARLDGKCSSFLDSMYGWIVVKR